MTTPWAVNFEIPAEEEGVPCPCRNLAPPIHYSYHELMGALDSCVEAGANPVQAFAGGARALIDFSFEVVASSSEKTAREAKDGFMRVLSEAYDQLVKERTANNDWNNQ